MGRSSFGTLRSIGQIADWQTQVSCDMPVLTGSVHRRCDIRSSNRRR